MTLAAVAFIGYAAIFFVRNFTGDFLELGIGSGQVASSKDKIKAFDNALSLHQPPAPRSLRFLAATGLAVAALSVQPLEKLGQRVVIARPSRQAAVMP
jgi:hypothetical protein